MGYPGPGSNHPVSERGRGTAGRPPIGRGRGGGVLRKWAATGETEARSRARAPSLGRSPSSPERSPARPIAVRPAPRPGFGWSKAGLCPPGMARARMRGGAEGEGRGGGGGQGGGGAGGRVPWRERRASFFFFSLSLSAALLCAPPRAPSSPPLTPSLSLSLSRLSSLSAHLALQGPHYLYFRSNERSGGQLARLSQELVGYVGVHASA